MLVSAPPKAELSGPFDTPRRSVEVLSNCLGSQAIWEAWCRAESHRAWSRIMTLMIVSSFLIAAVSATFFALPAAHSRS